jgi:hypothetical protein
VNPRVAEVAAIAQVVGSVGMFGAISKDIMSLTQHKSQHRNHFCQPSRANQSNQHSQSERLQTLKSNSGLSTFHRPRAGIRSIR